MNIQMNNILLLCVLVMLSFEVDGGAYCQGCKDVLSDNSCATKPYVCKISRNKRRRCFIQRTQRNGIILKVTRGCSYSCRTGMKTHVKDILLLFVLVILSLEIVEGAQCHGCLNVGSDHECIRKDFVCTANKRQFCYVRKVTKGGKTVVVDKGCTSFCKNEMRVKPKYRIYTWCCITDFCNSMRIMN
ncbi:acrosomal protein SP-10 isoform X2 [Paroedura picta]|uniref:acrosomal protein SP-10 isoform X2 n=1 Tax=Paroedura picta TaxID=143630 RepID=UPI004057C9BC